MRSSWWIIPTLLSIAAVMVAVGGGGWAPDRNLLSVAQHEELVPAARIVTELGGWIVILSLGFAVSILLFLRRERRRAFVLAGLLVSQRLMVEILKEVFDRVRPDPAGHLVAVHSMAFPSGHAANSAALGLGLAFLVVPPRWRAAAIAVALLYTCAVGLSRLVLGVHWPSDVVGGWAFGAAWALLLLRLAEGTSARDRH